MADKYDRLKTGTQFYRKRRLEHLGVYLPFYILEKYRRAARRKGWSLRRFMTWFLSKKNPR